MAMVQVWNDNVHPYREMFREREIKIPAKGFIEMDEDEAQLFKGTFAGILVDADDNPDPRGYKMIRIEPITAATPKAEPEKFVSHRDGKSFDTEKELKAHLEQFKDETVVDEDAEQAIKEKKTRKKGAA